MGTATIIDVRKTVVTSGPRLGQLETLISYKDHNNNFFLLIVPSPDASEAVITDAIKKDIAARNAVVGKTITL